MVSPITRQTIYITYELPQGPEPHRKPIVRAMKKIEIVGKLVRWKAGEFENASGIPKSGVKLTLSMEGEEDLEHRLVDVPSNARKVHVHLDRLPDEYRDAMEEAA